MGGFFSFILPLSIVPLALIMVWIYDWVTFLGSFTSFFCYLLLPFLGYSYECQLII